MHFVDIWQGNLAVDGAILQVFTKLLDKSEQERLQGFKIKRLSDRFIAVRGWLRISLASYLQVAPESLQFDYAEYGKPSLLQHSLYFNLSHSADTVVIAIADLEQIGVDIERIRPRSGLQAIARRCFSEQEFAMWTNSPEEYQLTGFYQLWTKKEAFVKAVGRGIAVGLDECVVDLVTGRRFLSVPKAYGLAENWRVVELLLPQGWCGALVTPDVEFELRFCQLEDLY